MARGARAAAPGFARERVRAPQHNFHLSRFDDRFGIRGVEKRVDLLGPTAARTCSDPVSARRAFAQDQPVARPRHRDVQHARSLGLLLIFYRRAILADQWIRQRVVASAHSVARE